MTKYILCISLANVRNVAFAKKTARELGKVGRRVCACVCVHLCVFARMHVCDRAADLSLAVSNLHVAIMFYNPRSR